MASPDRSRHFYFDTVSLSNFALAGRLDLLVQRYGRRGFLTAEVLNEIVEGVVAGYLALRAVEDAVEAGELGSAGAMTAPERRSYRELLRTLSPGEASCIAAALHRGGTVVTDDRAARGCCEERDIPVTGTIGILLASGRDGTLDGEEADALLQSMVEKGYYSPVRTISDLL